MNGSTNASPPGQWTADELMHGQASDASPPTSPNGSATGAGTPKKRFSMRTMKSPGKKSTDPLDWGMPGHLTKEEVDVFVSKHTFIVNKKCDVLLGTLFLTHLP
jgi:hypothetical protein